MIEPVLRNGPRLAEALAAMNELNSWARHPEGRAPRRAIYWLKLRYAIRDAIMAGYLCRMRAVQVTTKCHRCDKGVYWDWDGCNRGPCYTCKGTGQVTLKFIETRFKAGEQGPNGATEYVWHSPVEYSSWLGWPADDLVFHEAEDWTVKRDGKALTVVQQATLLNVVEEYWLQWRKQSPYENGREHDDPHRYYIFNYSLDLDYDPKGCVLCGGEHHIYCHTTLAPGLTRKLSVCKACEGAADLWPRLQAQPLNQLHPEIQRWRERHTLDFEATWQRMGWRDVWRENLREVSLTAENTESTEKGTE